MKDIKAKILSNERIYRCYFKMCIDSLGIAREASPGQFVQVRCSNSMDPLLRRPFSIHRVKGGGKGIEILYEVVGKGTEILTKKKPGDFLDVLGPLGTGFSLPETRNPKPTAILISGGIGTAPLVFLAEELARKRIKTTVLIGARTKKLILCEKDFRRSGAEVHIATDDGTRDYKGFVSKLFEQVLRTTNDPSTSSFDKLRTDPEPVEGSLGAGERRATIYACGPQPMLVKIAEISKRKKLKCQVSIEEEMACGVGVCLGCAVKVKGLPRLGSTTLTTSRSGREKLKRKSADFVYKLACKDGPIFDAEKIVWA